MLKEQMDAIYREMPSGQIPWNLTAPPAPLVHLVQSGKVRPCRAIEFGCGTGNYVIYLAGEGFDVTGVDFSEAGLELARENALRQGVSCTFIAADACGRMAEVRGRFDFAFDWELLHHIFPQDRERYVRNVHRLLNSGGQYLSVCFSEESSQFGGSGKFRKTSLNTLLYFSSEAEMVSLFEPLFDVEEVKTIDIAGKFATHKGIYAFLAKP